MTRQTQSLNLPTIDTDEIDDAILKGERILLKYKDGTTLEIDSSEQALQLYWEIKLRNRKKAFGI